MSGYSSLWRYLETPHRFLTPLLLGSTLLSAHAASAQIVTREVWNNVSGTTLSFTMFTPAPSSTGTLDSATTMYNVVVE